MYSKDIRFHSCSERCYIAMMLDDGTDSEQMDRLDGLLRCLGIDDEGGE